MKFKVDNGGSTKAKYSTRVKTAFGDCCYKSCGMTVCQLCTPCGFCYRFCADTPYRIKTMPIYEGTDAEDKWVLYTNLKPISHLADR